MELSWGRHVLELDVPPHQVIAAHRHEHPPPVADPAAAVRDALENPIGYPPLRRALTPDDNIAIAVDETLANPVTFLVPIIEHVRQAGVACQAITLICVPPSTGQPWLENLPDEFQDVRLEMHDPVDRKRLSYLATTRKGRRVYLNRTAVDADQLVLLTRRRYDCFLGYAGGEGSLFPALGDEAVIKEAAAKLSSKAPGDDPWPLHQEALEVAWLLGAPFLVQVVEGHDAEIAEVLAGPIDSGTKGEQALNNRWRIEIEKPADVVVACVSSDPARHTFADLARAFGCAARVVKPQGRIVVLSDAEPVLGRAAELMKLTEDPGKTLHILSEEKPVDHEAGFQWASAAQQAKLYLLSRLPTADAEDLFVTPLDRANQVERLLEGGKSCLVIPDAHKTLAVVRSKKK